MPTVNTIYRLYLTAGHHRQPRNAVPWVQSNAVDTNVDVPGTSFTRTAPATQDFTVVGPSGNVTVTGDFMFWSTSDGNDGSTQQGAMLTETVGDDDLTLVGWYLPTGAGNGADTAVIIDAYSVAASDFVDYDFVTVTSDPSLTSHANVDGDVSTKTDEKLQAFGSIPDPASESFEQWIVSPGGASAATDVLSTPAKSVGLAFATYRHEERSRPSISDLAVLEATILFGVIQDGGGKVLIGGKPVPIGPWGPLLGDLLRAISVDVSAGNLRSDTAARIKELLARDIADIAAKIGKLADEQGG